MISVSSIETKQDYHLGTTETNFYTPDKRRDAIYRTVLAILQMYDIPQYTKKVDLSFSSGVATLPSNCLRPLYMVDSQDNVYERVDYELFDEKIPFSYKIEYDEDTETEKVYIYNELTTDLSFRYIVSPDPIVSGDEELRFKDWWEEAISIYSVAFLLRMARNFRAAAEIKEEALQVCNTAWQNERVRIVGEQEQRLRSKFEKQAMFSWSWTPFLNSYAINMTTPLNWSTVVADTQALPNSGYNTNSSSRISIILPITSEVGDIVEIAGMGSGGWKIVQTAGQFIVFGDVQTTVGPNGYVESTNAGDTIRLVCQSDSSRWEVLSAVGNLTYV